jgi:iron complex outermembrane receptor protein
LSGLQDGEHATIMDVFATPEVIQDQIVENDANIFSTELRVDNHASGDSIKWLAGVYALDQSEFRLEHNVGMPPRGNGAGRTNPLPTSHLIANGTSETSSYGIFGEISFDISDRMNLTVGGRWTDEDRDYEFRNECWGRSGGCGGMGADPGPAYPQYDPATNCALNPNGDGTCGSEANPMGIGIAAPENLSASWDNFSPKVSLSFAIDDNLNIYGLYSEGFKSGGFQHDARNLQSLHESIVLPEEVKNYEIGLKGSYDKFRFAITAFNMEQEDAQNSVLVPLPSGSYVTDIRNYGGIEMTGYELEGTWLASANLLIGGNAAFYDGELGPESYTGATWDPSCNCVVGNDVSGLPTGLSNTYVLFGEYTKNMSNGSSIQFRADIQHRSTIEPPAVRFNVLELDGTGKAFERPSIDNIGMNITWTSSDGSRQVSFWGQNLLDEFDWGGWGPASSFHFNNGGSGPGSSPRNYEGRQRYGVDVRFNF